MYAGVDIGGTKTLVAAFNKDGKIIEQIKFPTSKDYSQFVKDLKQAVSGLKTKQWHAGTVAIPGKVDHHKGLGVVFGNLPWQNVPIEEDAYKIFGCPITLENDANLAGLSEAMLRKQANTVLYITISTGIGTAIIQNQRIVEPDNHPEGGHMMLTYKGKLQPWESFASGHAIVERFGKRAEDITDPATWKIIARDLSLGIIELLALFQPDLVVIGGGVGTYFERYKEFLVKDLERYETPLVPIPPIVKAERPELAVAYGCYDYAKYIFSHLGPPKAKDSED